MHYGRLGMLEGRGGVEKMRGEEESRVNGWERLTIYGGKHKWV